MLKMRVQGLICGGVTLVHFCPPLVVTWMTPSPVPAQSTLTSRGEGASAVTLPSADGFTVDAYLPALEGMSQVARRVRSQEIGVQEWPPLVVFQTPAVA